MDRTQAERLISEQVKPIFGFALKRCASIQDAEDVAQEIALRAFHALTSREDVADPLRYLWTVAHNVLANHYRRRSRTYVGATDPGMTETDPESVLLDSETVLRLRQEVAYLSRTQREIVVAYYFHGRKQSEIAAQLALPLGTVKWHLFEAKKELKQNMDKARNLQHLQFDPIRFASFGTEGSIGEEGGPWRIFRSALNQNIAYSTWRKACTIAEIAEAMGVSPVYVEDAVDSMAEQGYLIESDGKYRCTLLLTEADNRLTTLADHMYQEGAKLIAPALADALMNADLWSAEGFYPGTEPTSGRSCVNFALWALIPWCIANSTADKAIPFGDVATLRPDGAHNIVHAAIAAPGASLPSLYEQMDGHFSGPCWNESDGVALWQLDTCWSDKRIGEVYQYDAQANLALLKRFFASGDLNAEEYARLVQQGLIRTQGNPEGLFKASLTVVWLQGEARRQKLLALVRQVYDQHAEALTVLRQPYAEALLADTPSHQHKLRRYMLQNVYQSDWFIMHCLHALVQAGTLLPPADNERRSLHMVILTA